MKNILGRSIIIRISLIFIGGLIEIIGIYQKGTNNLVANILVIIGFVVFSLPLITYFIKNIRGNSYGGNK